MLRTPSGLSLQPDATSTRKYFVSDKLSAVINGAIFEAVRYRVESDKNHKILIFSDFRFESTKMTGKLQRSSWHNAGRFVTVENDS